VSVKAFRTETQISCSQNSGRDEGAEALDFLWAEQVAGMKVKKGWLWRPIS
jgi:hypothetical protein